MNKFMKINEVATKYKITKRTLRYYEEVGLIKSKRDEFSNYRYYNDSDLKRIEQILLLRELNFKLSEVKEILLSNDYDSIKNILVRRLNEIREDIKDLNYFEKVVESIIKICQECGMDNINFYELLKEQVYVNKKFERVIEMSQYVGEVIMVEFGIKVCGCCNELVSGVKSMRNELESEYKKKIPLVRIRDVEGLKDYEYRILIKGIIVKSGIIEDVPDKDKASVILNGLKDAVTNNLQNIDK